MPYYLGFILAVLAVPGVYYVFTLFLSAFSRRKLRKLAIEGDGKDVETLMAEIRETERFLEAKRGFSQKPILLLHASPSQELAEMLMEYGIVYAIIK